MTNSRVLDLVEAMQPHNRVLRLPRNNHGRDFVVGDIHGSYDLVWQAMCQVQFDPLRDRIISVGDLIDRGPGSRRCAGFLDQPYVHAIRGNHEDMLLDLYREGAAPVDEALQWVLSRNGAGWWMEESAGSRQEILARLASLPLVIELDTARGTVGFVHADVPEGMTWPEFIAGIEAGDPHTVKTALWGRTRIQTEDERGVSGVGRVYVGHTPQWDGLKRYGNVYAVDTGAVFAAIGVADEGRLTFANVMTRTSVMTGQQPHVLIDVRDDHDEAGGAAPVPFGAYAETPMILLCGRTPQEGSV